MYYIIYIIDMPSECFIFSSNPANGAINRSLDGSQFTVQFNTPLFLPTNAYNAKLEITQANIWNNSPNVSQAIGNNVMTIRDDDGTYSVVIPDGLYDIDILFDTLAQEFDNLEVSRPRFPFRDMFDIEGNEATNRVFITFKNTASASNPEILWNESTIDNLLGFTDSSPTKPSNPYSTDHEYSIFAENPAKFNAYNSFVIKSDLVNEGIQVNDNFNNIIAQIQITSNPGEIENYKAQQPNTFSLCNELIGQNNAKFSATFTLTSEIGIPLDTRGEYYDFIVLISWLEQNDVGIF